MKISWSILAKFVDLTGITPVHLAERLTMSGIEVSSIVDTSCNFDKVVVGRLKSVVPHPNADKLSLTEIEIPGTLLKVVCGAKNIAPGDVIAVALEGAVLPGEFKIKRAKIRGEESQGMICSERELGLAEVSEGIMHLPADTPLGIPIGEALGKGDVIIEIEVTPNRPDCLSHLGIARQICAILNRPMQLPALTLVETEPNAAQVAQVSIEPECGCDRYCARIIQNVTIGPSPKWLKDALEKLGQRSVNNVVDITNYVLLEIGHPLHAFDLKRLAGAQIRVRKAKSQENLVTLDSEKRTLAGGELVIADAERPVAIAGVMGGLDSEVTATTTEILLESAWFQPRAVRASSKALNLSTEASYRFERGTDPENGLLLALDRASQLIAEVSGGNILKGVINQYPTPKQPLQITLNLTKAERVLGMPVDKTASLAALSRLGFLVESGNQPDSVTIRVPHFRNDVTIEEDLIEELAQMIGFDRIPTVAPRVPLVAPLPDARRMFIRECRQVAAGCGLNEVINYSFMSAAHFDRLRLPQDHAWRQCLALKNPLSEETSIMRPALLPVLVETVAYNQRRGQERVLIFETGAVFTPQANQPLPAEPQHMGVAMAGTRYPLDWRMGKAHLPELDFYDLKGLLEGWFARLPLKVTHPGAPGFKFVPVERPFLHPVMSFSITAPDGREIGWAGALHPEAQEAYKLRTVLWVAEINLEILWSYFGPRHGVKNFSRFPSSGRDLALAVPEATQAGDVVKAIRQVGGPLLIQVEPFDVYRGENMTPGTKSLAFALTFQAQDRTLQDEEIKTLHAQILAKVQQMFGAQLR